MNLPPSFDNLLDTIGLTLFGALSGWLGYLMRTLDEGGKIVWLRSFLEAATSGLVGYLGILLCRAMGLSFEWTGVVVGTLGWLGATVSIRILEKVIRKKLGIENVGNPDGQGDGPAH